MLINSARLYERMARDGLAAVVATAPENVTYSSGYWAMSQWIRRGPQAYVLLPAPGRGDPCIVASTGVVELIADQDVWVDEVYRYGHFVVERAAGVALDACDTKIAALLALPEHADAVAALVQALDDRGLAHGRIGVDELGITPSCWDQLAAARPGLTLVRAAEVFRWARAVKTPEEIARLRASAQLAERSIDAALAVAREGATELDLACAFHSRTIAGGGMPVLGCIGFGTRTAMTNVQPSNRALRRGDVIRFDVGGRYMHYRADIARNAALGEPDARVATYHRAIRAGLDRAHAMIRPGVRAADVFDEVMETVRREGLPHYARSHVGHGIGLDGYDAPNLTPSSKDVFEEGMVLCIETPYYELGFAGLQVEDTLVVTRDGADSFMTTGTALRIV
ncbi:Xaa-Pro peptidase family protein [Rhodoplanes sp. TEM]|uniref:Xaa-Pro peptidase family protein n=1 Tax=Rhodoplanes tepidamans TaxID=200616 RepID=A0ABT5JHF3_RHOTP|nr:MULTISPECIES: Xaa-Pro peptidase family protein [Rhodoplanes]MDC7789012.1 Xaa-Pro peptidase family protein [Rhodoplanes tepidamans]MDC7985550.1 Xaa-Pro peptidase family protein [Rhodoplanes sp. TEM]MDQ0355278.1 Xaa-Pro aminopeptidase [Rhodoplanes tepidamans]